MKKTMRYLVCVILVALLIGPQAIRAEAETLSEIFPDANLAHVIADQLGKQVDETVTEAELQTVDRIEVRNTEITSIEGIARLRFLSELVLDNVGLKDISPLNEGTFRFMRVLRLTNNEIEDISPLEGFEGRAITTIDLQGNMISDIRPLLKTSSENYDLSDNRIEDASIFANFPSGIGRLYLNNNRITDIDFIDEGLKVVDLRLDGNMISDISSLPDAFKVTMFLSIKDQHLVHDVQEFETSYTYTHLIRGVGGKLVKLSASNAHTEGNTVTWNPLDQHTQVVTASFLESYELGTSQTTFVEYSGNVIIPLKYVSKEVVKPEEGKPETNKPKETDTTQEPNVEATEDKEDSTENLPATGLQDAIGMPALLILLGSLIVLFDKSSKKTEH